MDRQKRIDRCLDAYDGCTVLGGPRTVTAPGARSDRGSGTRQLLTAIWVFMQLNSDSFLQRRFMPTRCAFGRYRFYPRELEPHERLEFSNNRNPHLAWDGVPDGTRSFAIVCMDVDAPKERADVNKPGTVISRDVERTSFCHWVIVDIPGDVREIAEGQLSAGVTPHGKDEQVVLGRARQGLNDYTEWFDGDPEMQGNYVGYDGPCPPWNDELIHTYAFTLHALGCESLQLPSEFRAAHALEAMTDHVLGKTSLEGFYYICPEARFR